MLSVSILSQFQYIYLLDTIASRILSADNQGELPDLCWILAMTTSGSVLGAFGSDLSVS